MKVPEKVKRLEVALQYVAVLIALVYALYFWKRGWTEPALIFSVMGIGLILLGILLQTIRKSVGNDRHFMTISSILLMLMGLYCWMGRGIPYTGVFGALIGMFLIFNTVLKEKWRNICCTAVLILAVTVIISGEIKETTQDRTATVGQAAEVGQEAWDKVSQSNEKPKRWAHSFGFIRAIND